MNYLIEHATLVTVDKNDTVLYDASIAVESDRIVGINELPNEFKPDQVINANNMIVMPGLINSHTHSAMTLLRNYADDMDLMEWLESHIWPIESKLKANDIYWGSKLAIAEMIASGTTCFMDMYFENKSILKAVKESGIRAVLTPGLLENVHDHIDETKHLIEETVQDPYVHIGYGPHAIYTSSTNYLKKVIDEAKSTNTLTHIHLSESSFENDSCENKYGKSPTKYLESLGMFDVPTTVAHCVYMSDEDISVLQKHNVSVVHNPSSNLKLGNGFAPISKFIKNKVNVALGTDGASSNNNLNMFEEMHLTALVHKGNELDPKVLDANQVIRMATINGAKALNLDRTIGSIEVGKLADIIFIDSDNFHHYPINNIASSIVYSTQASDVKHVMIHGKFVYYNRQLITLNQEEIKKEVLKVIKRLY